MFTKQDEVVDNRMEAVEALCRFHGILSNIEQCIDREGELQVYWKETPSIGQTKDILSIWQYFGESWVTHYCKTWYIYGQTDSAGKSWFKATPQ